MLGTFSSEPSMRFTTASTAFSSPPYTNRSAPSKALLSSVSASSSIVRLAAAARRNWENIRSFFLSSVALAATVSRRWASWDLLKLLLMRSRQIISLFHKPLLIVCVKFAVLLDLLFKLSQLRKQLRFFECSCFLVCVELPFRHQSVKRGILVLSDDGINFLGSSELLVHVANLLL
ncbi:hypothetical protein MRB53_040755 [Persea americana]|nr:hypothetical protein MRB53_040755 [Persea americana]